MDSGNSTGSLQSSSTNGGDDESYDSRADSSSISAFLNPPPPAPPPTTTHHTFDHHFSLSNYPTHTLDPTHTQKPPNPLLNLDMVWSNSNSKSLRSDPTPPDLLLPTSGFLSPNISTNFNQQNLTSFNNHFPPNITENINTTNNNNNNNNSIPVRNPKKRSRASRRAPTTVLTTDTTNFRAMVQEFTGIPAPPFTSVSPFSRTRLDLFTAVPPPPPSSSSFKPDPPPYLLRPFPHKPFLNSEASVSVPTLVPDVAVTTSNYQNLLNMGMGMGMQVQNPIFNLQSLLQQPKIGSNSNGVLEDQLGSVSTSTTTNSMLGMRTNNNDLLGLDFNGDHKENNVGATTTRTEGMVESWICSSE